MREWLTVIIVLLIITVILDGLRRMRANRHSSLKMSLSMHQGTTKDDLDNYGSELPNGGARVIDVRDENDAKGFNQTLREKKASKQKNKKPYRIPQQVSLSLDEHVPMLMESVDDSSPAKAVEKKTETKTAPVSTKQPIQKETSYTKVSPTPPKQEGSKTSSSSYDELAFFDDGDRVEPILSFDSEDDDFDIDDSRSFENLDTISVVEEREAGSNDNQNKEQNQKQNRRIDKAFEDELEDVLMTNSNYDSSPEDLPVEDEIDRIREELRQEREQTDTISQAVSNNSLFDDDALTSYDEPNSEDDDIAELDSFDYEDEHEDEDLNEESFEHDDDQNYSEPEDVLVINVMAEKGQHFQGEELLNVVLSQGMRFGSMNIFHHHEDTENDGCILYSMANLVKPGTFDLNTMDDFSTPGVSLFMPLPLESDSLAAFDKMVATARAIAIQLYGDLKDENRSVFTKQTIEHYRSRIQEFERKHRLKSPA